MGARKKAGGSGDSSNLIVGDVGDTTSCSRQGGGAPLLQAVMLIDDWDSSSSNSGGNDVIVLNNNGDGSGEDGGDSFRPLSYDLPKVLFPVLNVPMIEYGFRFLRDQCYVDELYIVCCTSAVEQHVKLHCSSSNPDTTSAAMRVHVVCDASLSNAGDMLRELDKRNVIVSDPFLLVWGDLVTSCNHANWLRHAIGQHRRRRAIDSTAIMTCNFQRNAQSSLIVGIDPTHDGRIFVYDDRRHVKSTKTKGTQKHSNRHNYYNPNKTTTATKTTKSTAMKTNIPCSFLNNCTREIVLCSDLVDVGIDLCSPDVLARFSDEFDYRQLKREFVTNSVAEEEEGLQNKIYAYILNPDDDRNSRTSPLPTATRIQSVRQYAAVSLELLQRSYYPVVPDRYTRIQHFQTPQQQQPQQPQQPQSITMQYTLQPHYVYYGVPSKNYHRSFRSSSNKKLVPVTRQQQQQFLTATSASTSMLDVRSNSSSLQTIMDRTTVVTGPSMIGIGCKIGHHCIIEKSVIGNNCVIGNNVVFRNSYIWDGSIIDDNVQMESTIIAFNVVIKANAVLREGCILGQGCIVGGNIQLPPFTRLTLNLLSNDNEDDDDFGDDDNNSEDDDDEFSDVDDDDNEDEKNDSNQNIGTDDTCLKHNNSNVPLSDWDEHVVGADGKGRLWRPRFLLDDDDDDDNNNNDDESRINKNDDVTGNLIKWNKEQEWLQANCVEIPSYLVNPSSTNVGDDDDEDYDEDDFDDGLSNFENPFEDEDPNDNYDDGFEDDKQQKFDMENDDDDLFAGNSITLGTGGSDKEPAGNTTTINGGAGSGTSGGVANNIVGRQKGIDVVQELKFICLEYETTTPIENLIIELNSFKFSQNATYADCTRAATLSILEKMGNNIHTIGGGKLVTQWKTALSTWSPLLRKMSIGLDEEKSIVLALVDYMCNSGMEQSKGKGMSTVTTAETKKRESYDMTFRLLLQTLHDEELISEEAILAWAADQEEQEEAQQHVAGTTNTVVLSPQAKLFHSTPVQEFLKWLDQDSEDDDEDEDEDDEEEDDDN